MPESAYTFRPAEYERELSAIIAACQEAPRLDDATLQRILRRYPKDGRGFFSKSQILHGYRWLVKRGELSGSEEEAFLRRLRMKPIRTRSGVAPVTVLTQPFPCPGRCIFCPSDVRMPKSYISSEPGAQRAAEHRFDPYRQTASRLRALAAIGHPVDKVELIVLGGTWSSYPEGYRLWFLTGCFEALNDFEPSAGWELRSRHRDERAAFGFEEQECAVDGGKGGLTYNQAMRALFSRDAAARPASSGGPSGWKRLKEVQRRNERAFARCVGLSLETRPDEVSDVQVRHLRRLGATKIQLGYQSLDDRVLRLNRRGHDTGAIRSAMRRLRGAGFKIQAHWMPNLYGSSPDRDVRDFARIFSDAEYRPDELKIYPCALVETAELMQHYRDGSWRPYDQAELRRVLEACLETTPRYCRLSRVVRDIPSTEIVDGNLRTNLREAVEASLRQRRVRLADIRSREIRGRSPEPRELQMRSTQYDTSVGRELFLEAVTKDDRLAAFLRLSLPRLGSPVAEIDGSAVIREVHVYGQLLSLGERSTKGSQHQGLGRELIAEACRRSRRRGYRDLAVISAVGTREYYRRLGFTDGALYQHMGLDR